MSKEVNIKEIILKTESGSWECWIEDREKKDCL